MGSFPRVSFVAFDSFSELKLSSGLDMAVLALSLDFLCGPFWTLVFDDSFSLLKFGFTCGVFENVDLTSFCKDRTFVTRNRVS